MMKYLMRDLPHRVLAAAGARRFSSASALTLLMLTILSAEFPQAHAQAQGNSLANAQVGAASSTEAGASSAAPAAPKAASSLSAPKLDRLATPS